MVDNKQAAAILEEIGLLLELQGKPFNQRLITTADHRVFNGRFDQVGGGQAGIARHRKALTEKIGTGADGKAALL